MEDNKNELLSNKLNNSLFKFLIREYYSRTINPFYCLKLLSKIYHTKVSDKLKEKCASFLFSILRRLSVTEEMQESITPIVNDMLDNVLTRKADYPIVLHYAFFLISIGNVKKAITTIQIFSNENRFMNSGEILFYKALIEYVIEKKTKAIYFIRGIEKAIPLIKHNRAAYYMWTLDFCTEKRMNREIRDTLSKYLLLNIHLEDADKERVDYIRLLLNDEDESFKRLKSLYTALRSNPFNYSLLEKVKGLAMDYYEDNVGSLSSNSSMISILKIIDEGVLLDYLMFLFSYYIYQPEEERCWKDLTNALRDVNEKINSKQSNGTVKLFVDNSLYDQFKQGIICFYKNTVFSILKKKLKSEIAYQLSRNDQLEKDSLIERIVKCLTIVNLTKEIITGTFLLCITPEIKQMLITKEFVRYLVSLTI